MTKDFIVDEEFAKQQAEYLKHSFSGMDKIITGYLSCIKAISSNVVQNGETADALQVFIGYAEKLRGNLNMAAGNISHLMESYLVEIDRADQYLF